MAKKKINPDISIERLKEISTWVSSVQDLNRLLELIIETATRMMDAKASSLLLLDKKRKKLYFKVATGEKKIDVKIAIGRGYVPSERHAFERQVDEIVIDSAFSPVTLVNCFIENTRVGQHIDFDKLILEVVTDGRITPREALNFATQIGVKHFEIFDKLKTHKLAFEEKELEENKDRDDLISKLALKINEIVKRLREKHKTQ